MASSKVQVPSSAPYDHVLRDHNRRIRDRERDCTTSSKAQGTAFNKNFKDLVRGHLHTCNIVLSSVPRNERNTHNHSHDENCGNHGAESSSSSSAAVRRRQSRRILDRWAARQAQEMITTIERQTHEAELMALSSNSHTVSERASTFLRESSPAPSDSSLEVPNLRASSLVQMWKEFEAETITPRANPISPTGGSSNSRINSSMTTNVDNVDNSSVGEPSIGGGSEVCDSNTDERYDAIIDWESDQTVHSERLSSSQGRVSDASERVHVADIIRRLTVGSRTHSSLTSWSDENDREQRPSLDQSVVSDQGEQRDLPFLVSTPRLRGRQAFLDLLMHLERDRQRELNKLGERHVVSRFPQRGRIQSLLRLRFLQCEVAFQDQQHSSSRGSAANQLCGQLPICRLRERFSPRTQQGGAAAQNRVDNLQSNIHLPNATQESGQPTVSDQSPNGNAHQQQIDTFEHKSRTHHFVPSTSRENMSTDNSVVSPSERQQKLQCQRLDGTLQGTSSVVGNVDLHGADDTERSSHGWEGDIITEEVEPNTRQHVGSYDSWETLPEERDTPRIPETADEDWLTDVSQSQRGWEGSRQEWFQERDENNSEDEEIHEVLERRTVSTLLSSGFRERMEGLILAHLQRSQTIVDHAEEEEEDLISDHEYNEVTYDSDQVASTSLQLPLPSRLNSFNRYEVGDDSDHGAYTQVTEQSPSEYHGSQRCSPFTNHPSLEMELICDLRGHMERIHHEMLELRKSIDRCMGMQVKLQKSIKQEVAAAVCHSIRGGKATESNRVPAKNGNCCICYEMPVDSLLYRCGHMCTCFKCAHELQWSSSRCPICRAPILDVVRAYCNT